MQDETAAPQADDAPEAIGWLELFFDLVVVVSLAFLAERLHEHAGWAGLGVFVVVFGAIWLTWLSFVIYTDIANEATHVPVLIIAAGVIALMATTLPNLDDHANRFAIGYVICRAMAARASLVTGRVLTSWPAVQLGGLSAVWIASCWVATPAKYWVWAAAVALELALAIRQASDDPRAVAAVVDRLNARIARQTGRREGPATPFVPVGIRRAHIGDRLGAFAIIVLGEGVIEVVTASSGSDAGGYHLVAAAAGFLILAGLWWLIFNHDLGGAIVPTRGLRVALPVHLVSVGALTLLAASLGVLLVDPAGSPEGFWRWLACGSLAAWFVLTAAVAAAGGEQRRWILVRPLVSAVALILIGLVARDADAQWIVALMLLAVAWTARAPRPPRPHVPRPAPA